MLDAHSFPALRLLHSMMSILGALLLGFTPSSFAAGDSGAVNEADKKVKPLFCDSEGRLELAAAAAKDPVLKQIVDNGLMMAVLT